jgi:hypothetical protein
VRVGVVVVVAMMEAVVLRLMAVGKRKVWASWVVLEE